MDPENFDEKIKKYRATWNDSFRDHSNQKRSEIQTALFSVYTWLLRHDKVWLNDHSPTRVYANNIRNEHVEDKDDEIEQALQRTYQELISSIERPQRISKGLLGALTGYYSYICSAETLKHLPNSNRFLERYVEDREAYRNRKISWAISELTKNAEPIRKWHVMKMAGIPDKMWDECWNKHLEGKC